MSNSSQSKTPHFAVAIRKFLLSLFVVITFAAYAIRNHIDATNASATNVPTTLPLLAQQPDTLIMNVQSSRPNTSISSAIDTSHVPTDVPIVPTDIPTNVPPTSTSLPAPTATPVGQYKDGTYVGPIVDAYYGNVQVEAIVQGGKLADVQFLDFPQDRRTSRFINQQATPWLTQEAVQVQNANVDLISGATFTSQAFVQSLQVALQQAHV